MHSNLVAWSRSLRFLQLTFVILLFLLIMPLLSGHPYISFSFHLVLLNALLVSLSASDRLPGLPVSISGRSFVPHVSAGLHRRHADLCL